MFLRLSARTKKPLMSVRILPDRWDGSICAGPIRIERPTQEFDAVTLRMEQPFNLSDDWKLNTRFDLPGIYKNLPAPNEEKWGLGDVDVQVGLIRTLDSRFAAGGGIRAMIPDQSRELFCAAAAI